MYIKQTKKTVKEKNYHQHQLMKSVRTSAGPRQEVVLNLKQLHLPKEKWKELANAIEEKLLNQTSLFTYDEEINALAGHFATLIVHNNLNKESIEAEEIQEQKPDFETVDLNSMKQTNDKSYGGEYVVNSIMEEYQFENILQEQGFTKNQINYSKMLVAGRMLHPGSERETGRWLNEGSSLPEIVRQAGTINDNGLHRSAKLLWKNHEIIEKKLADKARDIFTLNDKIILYDLTNAYFEGSKRNSIKAKRGNSKEKRTDCPLLTLALIVDEEGFPKNSKVYEGNIGEPGTFEKVLEQLSKSDNREKKTIVIDAGIATEDNLEKIKKSKYNFNYVAVSRKHSYDDNFWQGSQEEQIKLSDKKTKLTLKSTKTENEIFLLCHSESKEKKEQGIYEKRQEKFEKELQLLHDGFQENRKLKKYVKVLEKIGRLKEKYKVGQLYNITVEKEGENATKIDFKRNKKSEERKSQYGEYVLRTNRLDLNNADISQIHRSLTTIENSFRSMKSHLGLRPIHHQKDENSEAHLFVTVIAYHFVAGIIKRLRAKGINDNWNSVRETLNSHRRVTTNLNTKEDVVINIRQNTDANLAQNKIYKALKIITTNLKRVKSMFNKKKDNKM